MCRRMSAIFIATFLSCCLTLGEAHAVETHAENPPNIVFMFAAGQSHVDFVSVQGLRCHC